MLLRWSCELLFDRAAPTPVGRQSGFGEAAERADEADEARGEAGRSMVLCAFRGWVRILRGGARSRASQLIRGVGRT